MDPKENLINMRDRIGSSKDRDNSRVLVNETFNVRAL